MLTAPPTDRRMWRRLLARVHPDAGGCHELFVWCQGLLEHVAREPDGIEDVRTPYERRQPPQHPKTGERVPYEEAFGRAGSFAELARQAVMFAAEVDEPFAGVLRLLVDCYGVAEYEGALYRQQYAGASYRSLAAVAYRAGMSKEERSRWYRIAESIPLSQRHAGHILTRLQSERMSDSYGAA